MLFIKYAVMPELGLMERSAKPLFVGSNPTYGLIYLEESPEIGICPVLKTGHVCEGMCEFEPRLLRH